MKTLACIVLLCCTLASAKSSSYHSHYHAKVSKAKQTKSCWTTTIITPTTKHGRAVMKQKKVRQCVL